MARDHYAKQLEELARIRVRLTSLDAKRAQLETALGELERLQASSAHTRKFGFIELRAEAGRRRARP